MSQGEVQKEGLALQGVQKEGLALQGESTKPDKPTPKDKVKSERQASFEKSKQVKTAKNEQNKKEKEQRQKQKDKEKEGGYLGNLTHDSEARLSASFSCAVKTSAILHQHCSPPHFCHHFLSEHTSANRQLCCQHSGCTVEYCRQLHATEEVCTYKLSVFLLYSC